MDPEEEPTEVLSPAVAAEIHRLCREYRAELLLGRRGNVAAYAKRVPQSARVTLLAELFAIRTEGMSDDEAFAVMEKWLVTFPDFRIDAPRPLPAEPIDDDKKPPAKALASPDAPKSESLPLGIHQQIDAACVRFEAALKAGGRPDLTMVLDGVDPAGRRELLEELLRLALEYRPAAASKAAPTSETSVDALEQTIIGVLADSPPSQPLLGSDFITRTYRPGKEDADAGSPTDAVWTVPPPRLPDYEVLSELGRGGMGIVYKARQRSLQRLVALKTVLRAEFASADELQRFRQEAESAAQLDHPGIVPVFEVGDAGGRHYFSMAYVEGQTLSTRLQAGPIALNEAAELVRQMAVAVAYAHSKGIVHRDIKPGNVLLDKSGRPRITDFGLAKRQDLGNDLTMTGQIMGTPSYMPPEQAEGRVAEIGPHSDVYSLGAVLYACLTGRPPFQAASPVDTLHQVKHQEPARPRLLNKAIPRNLELIVLKCLSKRPADRYPSAANLGLDLGRWLRGEPIEARPVNRIRRAMMWCQRHRSLAGAVGVAAVALVVLAGVQWRASWVEAQRIQDIETRDRDLEAERERVSSQRRLSQLAYADQQRAEGLAMTQPGGDACQGMFRIAGALRIAHDLTDARREAALRRDLVEASRRVTPPAPIRLPGLVALSGAYAAVRSQAQKVLRHDLRSGRNDAEWDVGATNATTWAVSPNGAFIAAARVDSGLKIVVQRAGEREVRTLESPVGVDQIDRLWFSEDGTRLGGASGEKLVLWNVETGKVAGLPLAAPKDTSNGLPFLGLSFEPGGETFRAIYGADREFRDERRGIWTATFRSDALAWTRVFKIVKSEGSPTTDGRVIVRRQYREKKYWLEFSDAATGKPLREPMVCSDEDARLIWDDFKVLSASPDRRWVARPGAEQQIRLYDLKSGTAASVEGVSRIAGFQFTPDNRRLLIVGDQLIRIFNLATSKSKSIPLDEKISRGAYVQAICVSPDGSRLYLGLGDSWNAKEPGRCPGAVQVFDVDAARLLKEHAVGHFSAVVSLALSADGKTGYSGGADYTLRIWDAETGEAKPPQSWKLYGLPMHLALDPNGKRLLAVLSDGGQKVLRLFDPATGASAGYPVDWSRRDPPPAFAEDGSLPVASAPTVTPPQPNGTEYTDGHTVRTVAIEEGNALRLQRLMTASAGVDKAALSKEGDWLVVLTSSGAVEIRSTTNGELVVAPYQPKAPAQRFTLSPDERLLFTAAADGTIERWLTPKSLPGPNDAASVLDWIEWHTGSTWDPAQSKSEKLSGERLEAVRRKFETPAAAGR